MKQLSKFQRGSSVQTQFGGRRRASRQDVTSLRDAGVTQRDVTPDSF